MKYHLLLIAFLASILSLHAHTIEEDPHFKALLSKGLLDHKYALMFYSAKSCPQCAYMKEKVFTSPHVKAYLDQGFEIFYKDVERDDLPDGYEYYGIPTLFVMDKKGTVLLKLEGSKRPDAFLETLKGIQKVSKSEYGSF
jgi:thioredoxin-related protein